MLDELVFLLSDSSSESVSEEESYVWYCGKCYKQTPPGHFKVNYNNWIEHNISKQWYHTICANVDLIVTSTESLNAVRNIKSHKSHKVVQQSFGQLLRYLVLFIVDRYYTNRVCIQWIQQGWFYKDILHQQPGI